MADTLALLVSSIRDVFFSRHTSETRLHVPLQASKLPDQSPRMQDSRLTRSTDATSNSASAARMHQLMPLLARHVSTFCQDNDISVAEYVVGAELVHAAIQRGNEPLEDAGRRFATLRFEELDDIVQAVFVRSKGQTSRASTSASSSSEGEI